MRSSGCCRTGSWASTRPSPGTIYPRLARLEEEGLVTHDEVDGKKVYRITDKGRAEIETTLDDLADLEEEITESVRDIAREVTEDVRDTVRNLREELTWAARRSGTARSGPRRPRGSRPGGPARRSRQRAAGTRRVHGAARGGETAARPAGAVRRAAEVGQAAARQAATGQDARPAARTPATARDGPPAAGLGTESAAARTGDWPGWPEWSGWTGWAGRPAGSAGLTSRDRRGARRPAPGRPDAGMVRDLERMAARLRQGPASAAWHTEAVGTDALTDLRAILEDTLTRIKDEIFGGDRSRPAGGSGDEGGTGKGEA